MRSGLAIALLILGVSSCATPLREERALLGLNVGALNVFDRETAGRYGLELRSPLLEGWLVAPTVGFAVSEAEAAFVYVDFQRGFWLDERWILVPRVGVGAFVESEVLDLGSSLEFRSGLELEHRFPNGHRLGLGLFHLSNAGISDTNPGTEALVLSYSIPFPRS